MGSMADYVWQCVQLWDNETEFKIPQGWEVVEMDQGNFEEYLPSVQHLIHMSMKDDMESGKLKFIRRRPDELETNISQLKDVDGVFYIQSALDGQYVLATNTDNKVQLEPMDERRPQTKPNQVWKWLKLRGVTDILTDGTGRWLDIKAGCIGAGSEMNAYAFKNYEAITFMFVRVEDDKFLVMGTGYKGRQTVLTVTEGSDPSTVTMEEVEPVSSNKRSRQTWRILPYEQHMKLIRTSELEAYQEKGWRLATYKEVATGGIHHYDMLAVMSHTEWVQAQLKDGSQGGPGEYQTKEYEEGAEFGHCLIMDIPESS